MKIAELFISLGLKAPGVQVALEKTAATLNAAATSATTLVNGLAGVQNALLGLKAAAAQAQQGVAQASQQANTAAAQQTKAQQQLAVQTAKATQQQQQLNKAAKAAQVDLGKMTTAVTALNGALVLLMRNAMQTSVVFKDFALQTGLSTDGLQKWLYIAKQNDVAGADLIETVKGLQTAAADIALGRGNIAPWQLLGISPSQDPFTILEQLRTKLKGMPEGLARSIAQQLGVSDKMFQLLLSDMGKLEAKYIMNRREQTALIQLNRSWNELTYKVAAFKDKLAAIAAVPLGKLIDALQWVVGLFAGLWETLNKIPVVGSAVRIVAMALAAALFAVAAAATVGVMALGASKGALIVWAAAGAGATAVANGLSLALAGVSRALVALAPLAGLLAVKVAVIVGVLGAAVLLAQDLVTYLRGGQSIFGDLVDAMEESRFVKALVNMMGPLRAVIEMIRTLRDLFSGKIDAAGMIQKFNPFSSEDGEPKRSIVPEMARFATSPKAAGASSSSVSQQNTITVTVDGAHDPKTVGKEVDRSIRRSIGEAAYQIPLPSI